MTTIREHNRTRHDGFRRKADYIVGITIDASFFCADCVGNDPAYSTPGPYGPHPVFSSNIDTERCDKCGKEVT